MTDHDMAIPGGGPGGGRTGPARPFPGTIMTPPPPTTTGRRRLPAWLRRGIPPTARATLVARTLGQLHLTTVCHGAKCPNRAECFARGTATFMILGDLCTRNCRFCAVPPGRPRPVDPAEPDAVAEAVDRLDLRHVVITCVTRDDLPDGGADHFAAVITAVRARSHSAIIEVLTSDFQGDLDAVAAVIASGPDIFNHNIETVPALYRRVRPGADYQRSLTVLRTARNLSAAAGGTLYTKSGLMLGLGETDGQVHAVLHDLRAVGCEILTVGQYLSPSPGHLPVERFVAPGQFDALAAEARAMGFAAVAAGPFVRSSYLAETVFESIAAGGN